MPFPVPFPRSAATVASLALIGALSKPARAAGPAPVEPPPGVAAVSFALEGKWLQSPPLVDGSHVSAGGTSLAVALRLTDQLAATAELGGLRAASKTLALGSLGLRGILDVTPVTPYLELALLDLEPAAPFGGRAFLRSGLGAEWQLAAQVAVGATARVLSPLGQGSGAGSELALHLRLGSPTRTASSTR